MNPLSMVTQGVSAVGNAASGSMSMLKNGAMSAFSGLSAFTPASLLKVFNPILDKFFSQAKEPLRVLKERMHHAMEDAKVKGMDISPAFFEPENESPFDDLNAGLDELIDVLETSVNHHCLVSIRVWKPVTDKLIHSWKEMSPEMMVCLKDSFQKELGEKPMTGGMLGMDKDPREIGKDMVERLRTGLRVDVTELNDLIKLGVTEVERALAGVFLPPQVQLALRVPGIETIVQQVLVILASQLMEDLQKEKKDKVNSMVFLKNLHFRNL